VIAVSVLSLYILLFTEADSPTRRGAVILLAATAPMLWSRLLFRFLQIFNQFRRLSRKFTTEIHRCEQTGPSRGGDWSLSTPKDTIGRCGTQLFSA
jgi:hypothetical protein